MTSESRERAIPRTGRLAALVGLLAVALATAVFAAPAGAVEFNPATCTPNVTYDPSIPTPESVVGTPFAPDIGGTDATNNAAKKSTEVLYPYLDALADAAPEMVIQRSAGTTSLGRDIPYLVVTSPENLADLEDDAEFWRNVHSGDIAPDVAERAVNTRPAFAWITATVHGNEPASSEGAIRAMYELAARRDCANYQRLTNLTTFFMPVQNPDGRDQYARTNAWLFDLNRDWATQEHVESHGKLTAGLQYPSVVYVDAHQQGGGSYFFPPNEDPAHHEISNAAMTGINSIYGPALQKRFNDQNISYNNYSSYDLFTPEYGDTVPSLLLGSAGMTYEKGRTNSYAKQVYDQYIALDETLNTTSRMKRQLLGAWVKQFYEAIGQGAIGELQPNRIISPTHTISWEVPDQKVFGYYYLPNNHDGDTSKMLSNLLRAGVKVYRLDSDTPVAGMHTFGDMTVNDANAPGPDRQTPNAANGTLPAGTLYIPMAQAMKHYIQAILGEDPFVPYAFFYDVAGWSFSQLKGMSGNGYLMEAMPSGVSMTEIGSPDFGTTPEAGRPFYAFNGDSSRALIMAWKLAQQGASVYRSEAAFTAGGKAYTSGSVIVDGASLPSGVDLASLSDRYQAPIAALDVRPGVNLHKLEKPKLAIYAGNNPVVLPPADRCSGSTTFCQAYFTLSGKMGLDLTAVTTAEIANGDLTGDGYTALFNVNTNITGADGPGALTALQSFVNGGGNYFGFGSNAMTPARSAGLTNANTTTNGPTGGVPVKVDFNTASPLSWGFDNGGFLFRASGSITIDPASLAGNGGTIPDATEAIRYPNPTLRFAYATNIANLNGKTAAVDQKFGSGSVTLLSVDPTFRSWLEGAERLILNGVMYPNGEPIPAATALRGSAPESRPVPKAKLPKVKSRPAKKFRDPARDVKIRVAKRNARKLKRVFRHTTVPKKARRKAVFRRNRRSVTLVVKGMRNNHRGGTRWADRVVKKLARKGVRPTYSQI